MVMPGDNIAMTVKLIAPIAMEEGLRFAIREGGRTVGAGVVAKSSSNRAIRGAAFGLFRSLCCRGIAQLAERRSPKPKVGVRFPLPLPLLKERTAKEMADKIKFALALVLLAAGVAAFYLLSEQAMIPAGAFGARGRCRRWRWPGSPSRVSGFRLRPRGVAETKKVVATQGNVQTTGMVFAFVVVMAVFLWLTDKSLGGSSTT